MLFYAGSVEKWLRVITSIGALYLDSSMSKAVVPLLSNWDWAEGNVSLVPDSSVDGDLDIHASFTVSAMFFSTGLVEIVLSPIAGMVADQWGLDLVVLCGLHVCILKCLLYGVLNTTVVIVLTNRILQGVISACVQTMAMARIRDVYDEASAECTIIIGVAMCKLSFGLFAGLFVGELFHIMANRVFLLFIPVAFVLIVCI